MVLSSHAARQRAKRRRLSAGALAVAVLLAGALSRASAQVIVFDPQNFTKNVETAINTAKQVTQQAQMIANQIREIEMQAQELAQLPKQQLALVNGQWQRIRADLLAFRQVLQVKGAISVVDQNLDQEYAAAFTGYSPTGNYAQNRYQLDKQTLATILSSLHAVGIQAQGIESDVQLADTLRQLAKTPAAGQVQALQAANEISSAEFKELVQIRQLQMAQYQAELAFQAKLSREHQQDTLTTSQQQAIMESFWNDATPAPQQ